MAKQNQSENNASRTAGDDLSRQLKPEDYNYNPEQIARYALDVAIVDQVKREQKTGKKQELDLDLIRSTIVDEAQHAPSNVDKTPRNMRYEVLKFNIEELTRRANKELRGLLDLPGSSDDVFTRAMSALGHDPDKNIGNGINPVLHTVAVKIGGEGNKITDVRDVKETDTGNLQHGMPLDPILSLRDQGIHVRYTGPQARK